MMLYDLEEPGALENASVNICHRMVLLISGPDNTSRIMLQNILTNLDQLGLLNACRHGQLGNLQTVCFCTSLLVE